MGIAGSDLRAVAFPRCLHMRLSRYVMKFGSTLSHFVSIAFSIFSFSPVELSQYSAQCFSKGKPSSLERAGKDPGSRAGGRVHRPMSAIPGLN
jgi:hypothetical protein